MSTLAASSGDEGTELLRPSPQNLLALLRKGYSLRELLYWGIRIKLYSRVLSALRTSFMKRGKGTDIDCTAVVQGSKRIALGEGVFVQRNAWLAVPLFDIESVEDRAYLEIGDFTRVGPSCTISAARHVRIGKNVLFGPNVTVLDHRHEYQDVHRPISCQGVTSGGSVVIEDNAWLGANSVVFSSHKNLVIGQGSVVSANSVVRESVPAYSVVAGNPARVVRAYNPDTKQWERRD